MPQRVDTNLKVKAGLFLAFSLTLFLGMLLVFGKMARLWRGRQLVHVAFTTICGLPADAVVRLNGVEVGHIKKMKVLHMDQGNLSRLEPISKEDLDFLPLAPAVRRELRRVPDRVRNPERDEWRPSPAFQEAVKEALRDKTMIELVLEVLQEGEYRRYRVGDNIQVATTLLGDVTVEMTSGQGAPLYPNSDILLIGWTGDLTSNLARGMENVKETMSTLTDVVGERERTTLKRSAVRLTASVQKAADVFGKVRGRAVTVQQKAGQVGQTAQQEFDRIAKSFTLVEQDGGRVADAVGAARKDIGARLKDVGDKVSEAQKEWSALGQPIREDFRQMRAQTEPNIQPMQASFRGLSARVRSISNQTSWLMDTLGLLLEESQPEFPVMAQAFKRSLDNLQAAGRKAKENIDLMIGTGNTGDESEYYTALDVFRKSRLTARYPRDVRDGLAGLLPAVPPGALARYGQPLPAEARRVGAKVRTLQEAWEEVRDAGAEVFLPPFTGLGPKGGVPPFPRKRAAWEKWNIR